MEFDAAQSRDDEHQKEKEEERHRSEETDASSQGTGLEFFRHGHSDLKPGKEALIAPAQLPARRALMFFCGRERVIGEIYVFEVGRHLEHEFPDLRDIA